LSAGSSVSKLESHFAGLHRQDLLQANKRIPPAQDRISGFPETTDIKQ
jgi:hypothetical protein